MQVAVKIQEIEEAPATSYIVDCADCRAEFDAMEAVWCNCVTLERSLVCPSCLKCFCKAPLAYKDNFWAGAPDVLWQSQREEQTGTLSESNPSPETAKRPLVLVVDDEPVIRKFASHSIERLGYGVIVARDGSEGLEMALKYGPDLILADALMPKLDGREMCARIKSASQTSKIKVIIMTSLYSSNRHKTEAFKFFRVDDYLLKPLDLTILREALQKHLRQ